MKTREEWLRERKSYLGGTDVAAICGVNPYATPLDVYLDKTSEDIDRPTNDAMGRGTYFEPIVAELYAKKLGVSLSEMGTIYHPEYNFMAANVDRFVNGGEYILECKTVAFYKGMSQDWGVTGTDLIPLGYQAQIAWYLEIADKPKVDVAALFSTHDVWNEAVINRVSLADVEALIEAAKMELRIYPYQRNAEMGAKLIKLADIFWNKHIVPRIAPAPANAEEEIKSCYSKGNGGEIKADTIIVSKLKSLKDMKTQEKRIKEEINTLSTEIKQYMKESEVLLDVHGACLATWKNTAPRPTFESERFMEEHQELYAQYIKPSKESRMFLIK